MGLSRVSGRLSFTLKAPSFTASVCPRQVGEQRGRWVFGADMNPSKSDERRFWSKVDKSGNCWEWMAGTNKAGYGQFWLDDTMIRAHRLAYYLVNGSIPDGMYICHRCDNPKCVNPTHLFLGTQGDNQRDSFSKGRNCRGEKNGQSKLVENDIREIRRLYSLGNITQMTLGRMWGISDQHVSDIVNGKRWKYIYGSPSTALDGLPMFEPDTD